VSEKPVGSAQFGMIGLGVMGSNLALNIADHGFSTAVWNREPEKTAEFMAENAGKPLVATPSLEEFVAALARPRRAMMMISAGRPIDETIDKLLALMEPGDVIIDGGNSWFKETQARAERVRARGLHFVGSGVSGGEEGARRGPSLMPGGTPESWETIRDVFESIAARSDSGACVTYCGPDGAGHFVKMVHNGIEYGDMQLIAEAYDLLRRLGGFEAEEIADVFDAYNAGDLQSFLIEITATILRKRDEETGAPLVEKILDKAGQKGTGKWTAQVALDLAVPIPTIGAAIDARVLSSMKAQRVAASKIYGDGQARWTLDRQDLVQGVHDALYAAKVCSYAQGFALIAAGSREYKWDINLREIARIWKAGCIIRARFLDEIMSAYAENATLSNLLVAPTFQEPLRRAQSRWRSIVSIATGKGIAVPALASSLTYFDSYTTATLPQNLTQAQRDFFGAHTYQRNDRGDDAPFVHTDWE
jgi:6-phosphogluconate dehydrogenase